MKKHFGNFIWQRRSLGDDRNAVLGCLVVRSPLCGLYFNTSYLVVIGPPLTSRTCTVAAPKVCSGSCQVPGLDLLTDQGHARVCRRVRASFSRLPGCRTGAAMERAPESRRWRTSRFVSPCSNDLDATTRIGASSRHMGSSMLTNVFYCVENKTMWSRGEGWECRHPVSSASAAASHSLTRRLSSTAVLGTQHRYTTENKAT